LGRPENAVSGINGQITVVRYKDYAQQYPVKFNPGGKRNKSLLEKIFLRLPFLALFPVFGLLYFFHEIAFAITVQPGLVAVNAKLAGNIVPVQLKTGVDKKPGKVGTG